MKRSLKVWSISLLFCTVLTLNAAPTKKQEKLQISTDSTGNIVLTWNGNRELHRASGKNGHFRKIHGSKSPYVIAPTEDAATFSLAASDGGVVSGNIVGYVNLTLPPGLSLIANPLYYTNNSLQMWLPNVPPGSQVYKYTADEGYEVSTFDEIDHLWSNPDLQVPIGTGFFFRNASDSAINQTFVGEVLQGSLTNSLPAGHSTKGSLVPMAATLNHHGIPGEPGDQIRTFTNDMMGGGTYDISTYDAALGWVPDLQLGVGQGFFIEKQYAQDWIRYFSAN